jgi:hypothetical protein
MHTRSSGRIRQLVPNPVLALSRISGMHRAEQGRVGEDPGLGRDRDGLAVNSNARTGVPAHIIGLHNPRLPEAFNGSCDSQK